MKKRTFIRRLGQAAAASPFLFTPWPSAAGLPRPESRGPVGPEFWDRIRADYDLKPDYANLENGYYNIIPRPTLEAYLEKIRMVNYEGSYYMRTVQWENKQRVAARLSRLVGCPEDTLVITRNTTESLDLIIGGYPWEPGDEAIYAQQDYGAMQMHFEQVGHRYGVVNKVVSLPLHPASDAEIVSLYEAVITPRTRLMLLSHMVNITGQILPVRKICDMAHRHGVEVLVDGAHCVGHIAVNLEQLDCDYYGSSLHKWLSVPLGAGLLYVRKAHIPKIWPLLAEHERPGDIGRLNHTGTHPVHTDLAIEAAIDYLEHIGLPQKEARLRYLQRYWSTPLRNVPGVVVNTPEDPERSCGIANVGLNHLEPQALAEALLKEFGIFTVAIDSAGVRGCRITPNVYTTTEELDRLIAAVAALAARHGP